MIVPSPVFLAFAAIAAAMFHLHRALWWHQLVLLAANLLFLASFTHNPLQLLPFGCFLALGYGAYRATRGAHGRVLFVALLALTLFSFFWLKRYSFIPHSLFLPFPYLLVGLSYVFFRVLHLIIDGYQNAIEAPVGWLSYLNYTLNFTSLVSGPIQRYQDYRRMEVAPEKLNIIAVGVSVERIAIGYFKVAIVSLVLSLWQHQAIDLLPATTTLAERVWQGMLVMAIYPVYLYFNFSGYVDVVIGVARFFGLVLPENFDRPFASENFLVFWSRWHMTLSGWLKTYVYNPLMLASMERITAPSLAPYLAVTAFFITFFLVGVWHGQTSEFLFFGVLQGGGVSANKLYQVVMAQRLGRARYRALCGNPIYAVLSRGLTFTWFAFTLLWFWSSWPQIGHLFGTLGGFGTVFLLIATWVAASVVLAVIENTRTFLLRLTWSVDPGVREPVFWSRYVRTVTTTVSIVITLAVMALLAAPAPDIVYKAF